MSPEVGYRDICRGYSEINWNGPAFIKHLTTEEHNEIVSHYDKQFERGRGLDLPTEKEATEEMIAAGKWTRPKEKTFMSIDEDLSRYEMQKKKIQHFSQIDPLYNQIKELKDKRIRLLEDKYARMTLTAESYASSRARDYQIQLSCFRDKALTQPLFDEDFEYEDLSDFYGIYNSAEIGSDTLKKICVSFFFRNLYSVNENLFYLFHKPLYQLSMNQISLLRYAKTFSKVAEEAADYPKEFEGEADKILMWYYVRQNGGVSKEEEQAEQSKQVSKYRADIHNPAFLAKS